MITKESACFPHRICMRCHDSFSDLNLSFRFLTEQKHGREETKTKNKCSRRSTEQPNRPLLVAVAFPYETVKVAAVNFIQIPFGKVAETRSVDLVHQIAFLGAETHSSVRRQMRRINYYSASS